VKLLLALAFLSQAAAFDISFDGHSVMSCDITTEQRAEEMVNAARNQNLDVWSHRVHKGSQFHVQVNAEQRPYWEKQFGCGTYIEDVQRIIDQQFEHAATVRGIAGVEALLGESESEENDAWYDQYHRFEDIVKHTKALADKHPELTKWVPSIGKSNENRDIPVIHITGHPDEAELGEDGAPKGKPQVWINGGQHAREWIAPATVTYMSQKLLSDYKKGDPKVKKLMNKFEFVVAPVINPDGYEYSHTGNRLWRKNMSKNKDGSRGVDLNRNWANHWGEGGASTSPSAIDYQGPSVASEPEVKACQSYIKKLPRGVAGIDFHSYGELILRSKGWTRNKSEDENLLNKMAEDMKTTISKVRGTKYTSEVAAGLYPTTGSTDDWMSENAKMWGHGWTIELPGKEHGKHGFLLPASEIKPASKEMYEGFKDFAQNLDKEETKRLKMGEEKWRMAWQRFNRRDSKATDKDELSKLLGAPSLLDQDEVTALNE